MLNFTKMVKNSTKNALLIYYNPSSYNYIKTFKYYNHIRILSFLKFINNIADD